MIGLAHHIRCNAKTNNAKSEIHQHQTKAVGKKKYAEENRTMERKGDKTTMQPLPPHHTTPHATGKKQKSHKETNGLMKIQTKY